MKPFIVVLSLCCLIFKNEKCEGQLSANFTANIVNGCSPIVVNFSDQSTGNLTEWRWDLGNGTISTLQNPSAIYVNAGFYTVRLWIKSGNNKDSLLKTDYIQVFKSPVVNFGSGNTNGCTPLVVNFNDQTNVNTGNIISWQWDFGDGILSTQQNPQHTYILPGNFNVTLKATNINGCVGTLSKSRYIINNIVRAAFTSRSLDECTPNKIIFQSQASANGNMFYHWDFGDGTSSTDINPIHTYNSAGIYSIKFTVQSESGCRDTIVRSLNISLPLKASFTCDNPVTCKSPAILQFTNQTIGNNNYHWDFGDNNTSDSFNPSHIYQDTGIYSVKLKVTNAVGCVDSLFIIDYIKVRQIYINMRGLPDSGCIPFTKYFTAYNSSPDSIVDYSWKIGNEISLSGQSPVYTFNSPGIFDLSLITTTAYGCKDTSFLSNVISAGNKPTANFTADIRNACASTGISFSNQSVGNITSLKWDFGDQSFSFERNPTNVYTDTGWMSVQLAVSSNGCYDTATYNRYIYTKPAVAKFKVDPDCSNPYQKKFTNFSIGADRWLWSFGDSTTSSEFSPVHSYTSQGNFAVTLKVWNDSTGCSYSRTKIIKILDVNLDFSATEAIVCKGNNVVFNTLSTPDITRYSWDFGDGKIFTTVNAGVNHVYKETGIYPVRLVAKDVLGCTDTVLKRDYIFIKGPKAKFAASVHDVCINSFVSFIDSSTITSPITKWEWAYGDGITDTLFSTQFGHSFALPGSYRPFVKLTDSMGCSDSFRLAQPIVAEKISSYFFISDSVACPGYNLKFVCPYAMAGITYRWDFGDGTSSSNQIPYHFYNVEGEYTVKLSISKFNSCTDSTIRVNAVKIKPTKSNFTISDSFSTCPPLLVQFASLSSNEVSESWNFGDGTYSSSANPAHYYTYPGEYTTFLYAKGHGACVDTMQKTIIIKGPKGSITSDLNRSCKPYEYNFTAHTENAVSYVWDFEDGVTQAGSDSLISYVYSDSGNFVPKIILEDRDGCRVPVFLKDTLVNIFVNPNFTFSDTIACNNENIPFVNSSTSNDNSIAYLWNFGDSIFSSEKNVAHNYHQPGSYFPSLEVISSGGCSHSYHSAIPIRVVTTPIVNMFTSGSGCAPLPVSFNSSITSDDSLLVNWKWKMGNGDTLFLQNPPVQVYRNPGSYTFQLSATNSMGCSSTVQQSVNVYAVPVTGISGDSVVCSGKAITLVATGAKKYTWLPGANLTCDTCGFITISPAFDTQYILKGVSEHGCKSMDTLNVNVFGPIQLQYNPIANICAGESVRLNIQGANFYKWSPSYGLSSTTSPVPIAQPDTTTDYIVIGFDIHGCLSDTEHIKVNVHKQPTVKGCDDKTIVAGTTVSLEAAYSSDVIETYWSPNDNLSRYDPYSVIVKPKENTEYTVKVKNSAGCMASDKVTVFVTCNKNNVFMPNLFSPNDDGVNDVFYPRGTGLLKVQMLRIFNRWGETVFEKKSFNANDPSAGWDGTYRGSKLASDVFVYTMDLICENSSILSLHGNVSLVK